MPEPYPDNSKTQHGWRGAWKSVAFRRSLLGALLTLLALASTLPDFFDFIATKPGALPPDPLIAYLGPADLSIPIFSVLYAVILLAVISVANRPYLLLRGLFAYALLLVLRMITMTVFTLEPPSDAIPLLDPVTGPFYPGNAPFLKDLFFSGHTATLALMAFLVDRKPLRIVAWCATLAVATMVVTQHVHWTVDVVAAPFAAWAAWAGAGKLTTVFTQPPAPASA